MIDTLYDFKKEKKILDKYKDILNLKYDDYLIYKDNLLNVSDTGDDFSILQDIKNDINESSKILFSILTIGETPFKIKDIKLDRKLNGGNSEYYINDIKYDLKEADKKIKETIINDIFGNINIRKLNSFYNRSNFAEWIYYTKERDNLHKIIKEKFDFLFSGLSKNENLKVYVSKFFPANTARVVDITKNSIYAIKKDGVMEISSSPLKFEEEKINEIFSLLNEINYINAIEIDKNTDLEKLKQLLEYVKKAEFNMSYPFVLKTRLLGRHACYGIYFNEPKILAVDLRYPFSFVHELTHHIDFHNEHYSNEERVNFVSILRDDFLGDDFFKLTDYYAKTSEMIARCGEISYLLNLLNYEEKIKNLPLDTKIKDIDIDKDFTNGLVKNLNYYFQGKEIYFNLENRTIEDLNIIYNFYAPLLRYKTNLEQKPILKIARDLKNKRIYTKRAEKKLSSFLYDFNSIFNSLENGLLKQEYTREEIVSIFMEDKKQSTYIISFLDDEEKIQYKVLDDKNYKNFNSENRPKFVISNSYKVFSDEKLDFLKYLINNNLYFDRINIYIKDYFSKKILINQNFLNETFNSQEQFLLLMNLNNKYERYFNINNEIMKNLYETSFKNKEFINNEIVLSVLSKEKCYNYHSKSQTYSDELNFFAKFLGLSVFKSNNKTSFKIDTNVFNKVCEFIDEIKNNKYLNKKEKTENGIEYFKYEQLKEYIENFENFKKSFKDNKNKPKL